jgi:hypothetical protein
MCVPTRLRLPWCPKWVACRGFSAEVPGFTEDLLDWDPPEFPRSPGRILRDLWKSGFESRPARTTRRHRTWPRGRLGHAAGPERAGRPGPSLRWSTGALSGCLRSRRGPSWVTGSDLTDQESRSYFLEFDLLRIRVAADVNRR